MSFEICYKFHEKGEDGEYNREEIKEKVVKVGKPYEDTPLEEVAGKIIAQLARRNILIVDVQIYEYTKKKLNYSEDEDGIKIKGRKFKFDDGPGSVSVESSEESVQEQLLSILQSNPALVTQLLGQNKVPNSAPRSVVPRSNVSAPMRYELFDPVDESMLKTAMQKGWKFTHKKRYPIFQEKPASINPLDGMLYVTIDDEGKTKEVSDKYFIIPPKLTETFLEDGLQYVGDSGREPKLSYGGGGSVNSDMPDLSQLRKRR